MKSIFEKIEIIFENENYLVINKPAGLVVHPDGRTEEPTLVDWILEKYPNLKEVGEPLELQDGSIIYRPGIVHRIDRETSGVLVVAKNQESFLFLKDQFQKHSVEKKYNAFLYGNLKADDGIIDRPIARSSKDFRLWSAQRGSRGKQRDAVTFYKVLFRSKDVTYIEAFPRTGRTHQIRVHFKAINHPIVADRLYAPKQPPILGFNRTALHARSISFSLSPAERKTFEAPLPEDFENALSVLGAPLL